MDQLYQSGRVFMVAGHSQGKEYIRMCVGGAMRPEHVQLMWDIVSKRASRIEAKVNETAEK